MERPHHGGAQPGAQTTPKRLGAGVGFTGSSTDQGARPQRKRASGGLGFFHYAGPVQTRRPVLAVLRRPLVVLMLVLSTWTLADRVHAQAAGGAPPSANQIALARQQFEY